VRFLPSLALLGVALACERSPGRELPPPPSAAPSAEELRARAVASVLRDVRSGLSLAAPEWRSQPLAFGRRLLVRLAPDRAEVFALPELKLAYEAPLPGAVAVGELAGGTLVAAGTGAALRFDPGAKAAVTVPPLVWVPGTELVPERRYPNLLWAVQRGNRMLARQRLPAASGAPPSDQDLISPAGYEGGALTVLRDGALLYRSNDGVRRGLPGGRSVPYRPELVPWRLLPGRRIDQAWAVAADGAAELWQITDRLVVVSRLALGAAPFDVAASEEQLAAVVIDEGKGTPRRFRLLVYANDGTRVLERALPDGPPPSGENWAELAVRDRYVALSESEPLVAVGGPGSLQVFRLPDGATALQR
jgi:hypothetical protein